MVYDFVDKCPKAAGLASDGGCPVIKESVKTLMTKAMAGVSFDNGKATLTKKSLPVLDEVAKVMMANPSYLLKIDGHTDNVGDPAKNLQLSEDRAKAVKAYVMGKGVAESRIKATGYGDTQPKASNATAKGKAINRRVEFLVSFEQ
jgi:outer membrane protein OmpA-like peptidoglycan-associated protein